MKNLFTFFIGILAVGLFIVLMLTPYVKWVMISVFLIIASYIAGKLIVDVYTEYRERQK